MHHFGAVAGRTSLAARFTQKLAGESMRIAKKAVAIAATSALLVLGGMASAAVAGGAGGGTFSCSQSGIPGWGTVTSQYNHPTLGHYAEAVGKSTLIVSKPAGTNAIAKVGRTISSNYCYWGTF